MTIVRWVAAAVGIAIVIGTIASVLETSVVPRGTRSRITGRVARVVRAIFELIADRFENWERRDRARALGAPAFLMSLLVVWLLFLMGGFTLVMWPFTDGSLATAFEISGSSIFTLGIASPGHDLVPVIVVFLAAASGLVVLTLQIAYLPSLYTAFNRRETMVTMLDGLAGSPAWGPEILARFALIQDLSSLDGLYERWSEWAADISESHVAFRSLIYFRSPSPERSWLISFLAVLDAAALHLALCPGSAPRSARRFLRTGYVCAGELAGTLRLARTTAPYPNPPVIDLSFEEFSLGVDNVRRAGVPCERTAEEAWADFAGWRVTYERALYSLAEHVDVVPALWSGPRRRRGAQIPPMRPERAGID
ncbi:MAG: hypothetical protein R2705_00245 [Ilumatobacteraceae bacterium]